MILLLIVATLSAVGYAAVKKQADAISNPTAKVVTQVGMHNNLRTARPDLYPTSQDVKSFANVIEGAPSIWNPDRGNTPSQSGSGAAPSGGGGGTPAPAGTPPIAPGGTPTGAGGNGLGSVGGRGVRYVF